MMAEIRMPKVGDVVEFVGPAGVGTVLIGDKGTVLSDSDNNMGVFEVQLHGRTLSVRVPRTTFEAGIWRIVVAPRWGDQPVTNEVVLASVCAMLEGISAFARCFVEPDIAYPVKVATENAVAQLNALAQRKESEK